MPEGQWSRGVTPRLRSGAAAESARLRRRRNGREELPRVRGQSRDERSYPTSEVSGGCWEKIPHALKLKARGGGQEELPHAPTTEARGGGWEEQPHIQGAQEGLEELSHVEGQEGRR